MSCKQRKGTKHKVAHVGKQGFEDEKHTLCQLHSVPWLPVAPSACSHSVQLHDYGTCSCVITATAEHNDPFHHTVPCAWGGVAVRTLCGVHGHAVMLYSLPPCSALHCCHHVKCHSSISKNVPKLRCWKLQLLVELEQHLRCQRLQPTAMLTVGTTAPSTCRYSMHHKELHGGVRKHYS